MTLDLVIVLLTREGSASVVIPFEAFKRNTVTQTRPGRGPCPDRDEWIAIFPKHFY